MRGGLILMVAGLAFGPAGAATPDTPFCEEMRVIQPGGRCVEGGYRAGGVLHPDPEAMSAASQQPQGINASGTHGTPTRSPGVNPAAVEAAPPAVPAPE